MNYTLHYSQNTAPHQECHQIIQHYWQWYLKRHEIPRKRLSFYLYVVIAETQSFHLQQAKSSITARVDSLNISLHVGR